MESVILLNKPAGITSFDAVSRCRRIFHERRIGHTGTLDPNASGLLIILTGRYTKFLPYCVKDHKKYHAEFVLGKRTDTQDIWGNTVSEKTPSNHSLEEMQKTAELFLGDSEQIPPMFSAVKVNGKKLYELARKGIEVKRTPKTIHVDEIQITVTDDQYFMDVTVSSGTYVRTLIEDFGNKLGEYAVMSSLERRGIEHISLSDACLIDELAEGMQTADISTVIDPSIGFEETDRLSDVVNGRNIELDTDHDLVMVSFDGRILAAYRRISGKLFHCERGLG